jgi:hypothetical protein
LEHLPHLIKLACAKQQNLKTISHKRMNDDRLQRFQSGTLTAMVCYFLLILYMTFIGIPTSYPMTSTGYVEGQIREATSMQELQIEFRSAVRNLTWGLQLKNKLLLAFLFSTFMMIVYLGWSLWMIHRLKNREE